VEYELYIAALKRPSLRAISQVWARVLPDMLAQHVDRVTAEALAAAVDGIALQSLITGESLVQAEVEPVIRRIVS
jgi:DNA-binding transcriptional regulator YbjK